MGENSTSSVDSGVCCSTVSPDDIGMNASANIRGSSSSHYHVERDLRAAKAGAFREREIIACALPFVPQPPERTQHARSAGTEGDNAALGPQWMEAGVNNLQYTSPDGQSSTDTTAQLTRIEKRLDAVFLLLLLLLERRFVALLAVTETILASARRASPTIMSAGTSSVVDAAQRSDTAEESRPSKCRQLSSNGGRCQQFQTFLGSSSVPSAAPRSRRRRFFHPDWQPSTPPVADCRQEAPAITEPEGVEQDRATSDGRLCQWTKANPFATYRATRGEPQSRRQPRSHESQFRDVPATESPSLSWTPNSLALVVSRACYYSNGYVEEVFSPVSELSGYVVKLSAQCGTTGGCAVLSFCAQLCASVDNPAVPWPFRGRLEFIIHHPTCSAKSRLYIVSALQGERTVVIGGVGKTIFRLTDPIPAMTLENEDLWAAGTLRLSISVRT